MSVNATELSESLAAAIAAAAPSIVHVGAREHLPSSGIVWSDDGLIVTAAHAVQRDDGIEVRFDDGSAANATLAGRDESSDVAVLRTGRKLVALPRRREANELRVGHLAIAAGRPGRSIRATAGIISAIGPEWRTPGGSRIDAYIDVDASLPPGFSGGALLDGSGSLIGMNTSRLIRRTGATIPHATLTRIVQSILAHGTITRPVLGIAVHPVETGLLVISVKSGSAAETAGIIVGDIILSPRDLHQRLRDAEAGERWTVVVSRGGVEKSIEVGL
jgi:S1-C subfamily serine protease